MSRVGGGQSSKIGVTSSTLPTGASTASNQTDGSQVTKIKETVPTDATKTNGSTALSYDVNGDLQYIDETINGTTYRTTLTYSSRVLVGISEAVEI